MDKQLLRTYHEYSFNIIFYFTVGPFVIKCSSADRKLYWYVSNNIRQMHQVRCTQNLDEASAFYVIPNTDRKHPNEFRIAFYNGDIEQLTRDWYATPEAQRDPLPFPLYLSADTRIFGRRDGPLQVLEAAEERNTRFVLHSRLRCCRNRAQRLESWVNQTEPYYIHCSRRFLIDGNLCVIQDQNNSTEWISSCVISKTEHEEPNKYMLFSLEHCKKD